MGVDKTEKCDISGFVVIVSNSSSSTRLYGMSERAMERRYAIINEIANKCEVDTCEISDSNRAQQEMQPSSPSAEEEHERKEDAICGLVYLVKYADHHRIVRPSSSILNLSGRAGDWCLTCPGEV